MATIVKFLKHVEDSLRPILQMQNQMQEYARMLAEPIGNMQAYFEKQNAQTKAFLEALERSKHSDIKAFTWMIKNGWPPLIHVPIKTPTKLMNYCKENKLNSKDIRKLLDNEIVTYHNSDMIQKTILPSWNKSFIFKSRMKILSSAVQAHLDSKYELSVPVLLTQLEGIPSEYFNYAHVKIKKYKDFFVPSDTPSKDELIELMFQYVVSVIYDNIIDNSNQKLMEINRHKILHGVSLSYAKEAVSLKLILIIDMLITYPKFVSLPHAKVYHMPHCPNYQNASKNNKKKHRMIHTKLSASTNGLKPCKRCLRPQDNCDAT